MNRIITARLEKIYDKLPSIEACEYYKNSDDYGDCYYYTGGDSIRNAFDNAMISYLLFLEHTRRISWIKIGFLRDYFSAKFYSTGDVSSFIADYQVFRKSFIQSPSFIFSSFIENEKENFMKGKTVSSLPMELLDFYNFIGKEYLVCDGSIINQETAERFILYNDLLEREMKKRLPDILYKLISGKE